MKALAIWKRSFLLGAAILMAGIVSAQDRYKESFKASKDMMVSVNTAYTNVIFETWNKDLVEVEAYVDGKDLSEKEKKEIYKNWKFDVLGNSKKVVITSNASSYSEGIGAMAGLDALKSLEALKSLKALEKVPKLEKMPDFDFDFNIVVPDIPEFREVPEWPFTKDSPNISNRNGNHTVHFGDHDGKHFDEDAYEKDKAGYVAKLNKKYNTKVTTKQVDRWLDEVDVWADEFSKVMESWGEEFGQKFSDKFGPDFERKMENWGEEFGKQMEAWGEEFGEKFGKDMEKWGEEFGKDMEKWGEEFGDKFGEDIEKWAEEFEKNAEEWAEKYEGQNGKSNNTNVIILEGMNDKHSGRKANKTIIVRMPKGTKTEVDVRYGELKMASAYNMKATLNYSTLTANSIDGGNTLIDASYGPVFVNQWNNGRLNVNYVEDCRLNTVAVIELDSNSSDVTINELLTKGILSGSFGNLYLSKVAPNFKSLDVTLENTDAALHLPNTSFDFYYQGKKSQFTPSKSLKLTESNQSDQKSFKGFHKTKASGKTITIHANYSNVQFQ